MLAEKGTVFITGANRSIGLELAKQYYQAGWRVLACARDVNKCDELRKLEPDQSEQRLKIITLDVSDPESIRKLTNELRNEKIDILINNAGLQSPPTLKFGEVTADKFIETLKVNTVAPVLVSQALVEQVANSRLKIIANMASKLGSIELNTDSGYFIYRATKAALNQITKSMSLDLKDRQIIVISLRPGLVIGSGMGGPNATTTLEDSVKGMRKILANLSMADSGIFINFDGTKMPW